MTMPDNDDNNIIRLPTREERAAREKELRQAAAANISHPPLINLPGGTKYLLALFVVIHVLIHVVLSPEQMEWIVVNLGFVPARFSGNAPFEMLSVLTPFTHMFIHGGWVHLAMNGVMLAAFGTGVERWVGTRKMMIFFILCGLCGALVQFALSPAAPYPVIGASGGLSGLFALAIVMMNRGRGEAGGRFGLLPLVILWVAISIGFGMMGSPDGSAVAWGAHVGGFLGGFIVMKLMRI